MREARIKVPADSGDAVYHCITRVVNGERLLDEPAREVLRKQLWQGPVTGTGQKWLRKLLILVERIS